MKFELQVHNALARLEWVMTSIMQVSWAGLRATKSCDQPSSETSDYVHLQYLLFERLIISKAKIHIYIYCKFCFENVRQIQLLRFSQRKKPQIHIAQIAKKLLAVTCRNFNCYLFPTKCCVACCIQCLHFANSVNQTHLQPLQHERVFTNE